VIESPPRDFGKAERLVAHIARRQLLEHLRALDPPPSHARQRELLELALGWAFQAGALWRDQYPDDAMFVDSAGIS
jgi:hypothetical protein